MGVRVRVRVEVRVGVRARDRVSAGWSCTGCWPASPRPRRL